MPTLALIGDSILDNAPYTRPEPDTTSHLQRLLPDWSIERFARDGATIGDLGFQLRQVENRPAVGVLSIGGNDAVEHIGLLDRRTTSSAATLEELLSIATDFGERYQPAARAVIDRCDRVVLCTIYEVQLQPARYAQLARVPLAVLNDRIIQIGSRLGVDVLDLRTVCTDPADFVRQIEPSARGAKKIAQAIAGVVRDGAGLTSGRVFSA